MELIDKIRIKSTPDKIWDTLIFFFKSTDNYKLWHKDHISCYWNKGKDFSPGSILIAEELMHGKKHKLAFKIKSIDRESLLMEYRMLFPFSIICSGGYFKLILYDKETEFIAQLRFRLGFLLKILFKRQVESLKEHMNEEGQNIKEFIEKA